MKKFLFFILALYITSSCAKKQIDIKSPCVSKNDGPCGPKKPVNDWWINNSVTI